MPAKIYRKVMRSGDSRVTALPPDWLRAFGIQEGDVVEVIYNSLVIIKPKGFQIDPDFLRKELDLVLKLESEEK